MGNSSQIYGKVSGVGERTYGAPPTLVGDDASSFDVEDLYIGWRSGKSLGSLGENVLDFTVGRTQYKLGHGLLLWDGAAEGGSRGGYWTNARKAFEFAAIGRFKPGTHTVEAFYLEKDELPESDTDSKLWGVNYEYAFGEDTTLGATYMKWSANPAEAPQRDGLDVYNVRAFTAPFPNLKALSFELEYAQEDNGDLLDSDGLERARRLSARHGLEAEGVLSLRLLRRRRSRRRPKNEAFDGLFTGLLRLGHVVAGRDRRRVLRLELEPDLAPAARAHASRAEPIGTGLIFYDFLLDNPASAGSDVRQGGVRARLVHGLERQRQLHLQLRRRRRGSEARQSNSRRAVPIPSSTA